MLKYLRIMEHHGRKSPREIIIKCKYLRNLSEGYVEILYSLIATKV